MTLRNSYATKMLLTVVFERPFSACLPLKLVIMFKLRRTILLRIFSQHRGKKTKEKSHFPETFSPPLITSAARFVLLTTTASTGSFREATMDKTHFGAASAQKRRIDGFASFQRSDGSHNLSFFPSSLFIQKGRKWWWLDYSYFRKSGFFGFASGGYCHDSQPGRFISQFFPAVLFVSPFLYAGTTLHFLGLIKGFFQPSSA